MARRLLRLTVAVGLTAYVLWTSDPRAVWTACRDANWSWIAVAVGLVLIDRALMAARWLELLGALTREARPPFLVVLRVFFVSSFVSNFVPSVAADSYRAYALARANVHLAESAASVLLDRLLGVLSVVIVAAAALPFAARIGVPGGVTLLLAITLGGCLIAGSVVFSETVARVVVAMTKTIPSETLHRGMSLLVDAIRRYSRHHGALVRVLVMSVLVQLIRVLQAACLGYGLGLAVPFAAYCAFVPIIVLIIQIPITINGLGAAQLAFDRLFVPLGAPAAPVFALSMLFLALGVLGTLPGAVFYALTPRTPRSGASAR
jgi:glycosyltransferase 2 family protein